MSVSGTKIRLANIALGKGEHKREEGGKQEARMSERERQRERERERERKREEQRHLRPH